MKIEKTKLCAVILTAPGKKGLRESEPSKLKFILLSRGYPGNAAIRKLTQIAAASLMVKGIVHAALFLS